MTESPRRRLEPDERREEILVCAAQMFSLERYDQVSLTQIATRVGVARGLVNHYFGTKRDLYLAVIREAAAVPQEPLTFAETSTLEERGEVAVTWFLDSLAGQQSGWINVSGSQELGRDPDLARILIHAEEAAVDRVLEAIGLTDLTEDSAQIRAMIRAYGQLARAAGREWRITKKLTREQVHLLLTRSLLTIVEGVLPTVAPSIVPAAIPPAART